METNELDFNFSQQNGKVATLESFLSDTDLGGDDNTPDLGIGDNTKTPDLDDYLGDDITDDDIDPINPPINKGENDDDDITPPIDKDDLNIDIDDDNKHITSNINYKGVLSKLIENKLIDNIEAFETEEGEISFEDMDIEADDFVEILKQKFDSIKESATQNKVSTERMSDFTKKLVEIEANGGNVQQALQSYQQYKNPLEGLDLTTESDQQAAIYLKYQAKGLAENEIVDLISTYADKGILEEKAVEAKQELEAAFDKHLEAINQEALNRKEAEQTALKEYRTSLAENLKNFELTDSYRKKLLDVASKKGDDGRFELDSLYGEVRRNPEKAAELVLFLTNKEEYLKQMTEQVKKELNLSTMKKFRLVKKGGTDIPIASDNKKDKNLIDLKDI